jgi:hypothetical protein
VKKIARKQNNATPPIRITVYAGARNPTPAREDDLSWDEIATELALLANEPTSAPPTADREEQKRQMVAWAPHALRVPRRANENVSDVTLLALDVDDGTDPRDVVAALATRGWAGLVYASPSDTPEARRFRVVAPIVDPVAPEDSRDARIAFAEALGLKPGCGVERAADAARLFFAGRLHGTPPRDVWRVDGAPVDVSALPAPRLAWGTAAAPSRELAPLRELPPANAGIAAALGPWQAHAGRKWDLCGAIAGLMRRHCFTAAQCEAELRAWLPVGDPSVNVDAGIRWALAAWGKPAEEVSGYQALADLVGAEHADVIERAVHAASWAGRAAAKRPLVAPAPWARPVQSTGIGRIVDLSTPIEPIRYLCAGLSIGWAGKVVGIHGYAGASKGLFLSLLALGAAAGERVLGQDVERVPVLYLDAETGALAENRIKRLAVGLGIDLGALHRDAWFRFVHAERPLLDLVPEIEREAAALDKGSGVVIALDSYSSATAGEENSSAYADGLWELGRLGTRAGALPIVTLHERKQAVGAGRTAGPLESISGTNRLGAALATSIRLTPNEENDRKILVTCTRAPEKRFQEFHLTWTGEGLEPLTATCEAAHLATAREKAQARKNEKETRAREKVQRDADIIETTLRGQYAPVNARSARSLCGLDGKAWGPAFAECKRRGTLRTERGSNNSLLIYAEPLEPAGVGRFARERPASHKPIDISNIRPGT